LQSPVRGTYLNDQIILRLGIGVFTTYSRSSQPMLYDVKVFGIINLLEAAVVIDGDFAIGTVVC
jgi:hypothetical protein